MVVTSAPLSWAASSRQDFIALPSTITVHTPQLAVRQPSYVAVTSRSCAHRPRIVDGDRHHRGHDPRGRSPDGARGHEGRGGDGDLVGPAAGDPEGKSLSYTDDASQRRREPWQRHPTACCTSGPQRGSTEPSRTA